MANASEADDFLKNHPIGGPMYAYVTASPAGGASGPTVRVEKFDLGAWSFAGGAITIPKPGTWWVGVDLFRKVAMCLPRLGHRGWVPVAKIVSDSTGLFTLTQISPVMPASRIPRTLTKIIGGQAVTIAVLGSSLAEPSGSANDWSGMILGTGLLTDYKIPGTVTQKNAALGGAPNVYQLAQLGRNFYSAGSGGYVNGEWMSLLSPNVNLAPHGARSNYLVGVDCVILTCLANGGDYNLSLIEPIIRNIRERNIEVIVTSDNSQGWGGTYAGLEASGLYQNGATLKRICDQYGVEFVDTAAYVAEAVLRYGYSAIYRDTIHMAYGNAAGRTAVPSGGYEVWARAIRSCITVDGAPVTNTTTYDFSAGTQGWSAYDANVTLSAASGALASTYAASNTGPRVTIPGTFAVGNTVQVTVDISQTGTMTSRQWGMNNGGWVSNVATPGLGNSLTFTLTFNTAVTSPSLLCFCQGVTAGAVLTIDNMTVVVTQNTAVDSAVGRDLEQKPLPPIRIPGDVKTPSDAHIILPQHEEYVRIAVGTAGTLGNHPLGANSFAQRFASIITSNDLLSVGVGKDCILSCNGALGYGLVRYSAAADTDVTCEVYLNGALQKTITFGATNPNAREVFEYIYTPTQKGVAGNTDNANGIGSVRLRVTAGTLKVAALVVLTPKIDWIPPEDFKFTGTWGAKETDSGSGMPGFPTDVVGSKAWFKAPPGVRRLDWIVPGRSNSQPVNLRAPLSQTLGVAVSGTSNILALGGALVEGGVASIELATAAGAPVAGNRSLLLGGAVVYYDR